MSKPVVPCLLRSACARLTGVALCVLLTACADPGARPLETPAPAGSQLPHLARDLRGGVVLSWVEERDGGHALSYARLGEAGWSDPVTVAEGPDWFVNWADVPSVQPLADDLWAAHWLVKQPGGMYAYDIALALSRDAGRTWQQPFAPHRDGTPTEHGFVSLWPARLPDGTAAAGILWLDGRHNLLHASRTGTEEPRTSLRSAVFEARGEATESAEVDGRVCDCCQTDATPGPHGLLVAYRDRTDREVRDIRVAQRGADGWRGLGTVADDGWTIDGCPVNGPAIAANGDSVAVAWYTEAGGRRRVQMSRRALPEGVWQDPVVIDRVAPLGRLDLVMLDDGDTVVSWMAGEGSGTASIQLGRVGRDGSVGSPLRVAVTEASRPAGFPRIVRTPEAILVAWTRWHEGSPRVVTTRVPVTELR